MNSSRFALVFVFVIIAMLLLHGSSFAVMQNSVDYLNEIDPPQTLESVGALNSIYSTLDFTSPLTNQRHEWQSINYDKTGSVGFASGKPVPFVKSQYDEVAILRAASNLFSQIEDDLNLQNSELTIASINHIRKLTAVYAVPKLASYDVYGAYLILTLNERGDLVSLKARGFGDRLRDGFTLGENTALNSARSILTADITSFQSQQVLLPTETSTGITLVPAFHLEIQTNEPVIQPDVFVNGSTGLVVAAENRVNFDVVGGLVENYTYPLYGDEEEQEWFTNAHQWIRYGNETGYTDGEGEYELNVNPNFAPFNIQMELRGRWVNVDYEDGADAFIRTRANDLQNIDFRWNEDNSRRDERGLYYHTNVIHEYWKIIDPNFNGLDYPMPAVCQHGDNYDNAFWNGEGMYFGDGARLGNLAYRADVIYHEYTHGVTGRIYQGGVLPYRDEPGALNEAWSDYFPCSITDEPYMGEIRSNGAGAMRRLDNDLIYPDDWYGEVHYDSRMISAAMWHSREVLGREVTDELFHFSKYLLGNTFITYFHDILLTNDNDGDLSNGTPHSYDLYEQFGRHGIGPGVVPEMQVTDFEIIDDNVDGAQGDNNGLWEAGESVRIEVEMFRDGDEGEGENLFYAPITEDVYATLETDHPNVEIVRGEIGFSDFDIGDQFYGRQSFLIHVTDQAELSFANFRLIVRANADRFEKHFDYRYPIGHPQVLLVRDGSLEEKDVTQYFDASMDSLNLIYDLFTPARPFRTLDQRLGLYDTVIWYTGYARENILGEGDISALEEFLDRGGNLFLTGQNAADINGIEEFLIHRMGVVMLEDSVRGLDLQGVEDDLIAQGLWLLVLGNPGARNQNMPSSIQGIEPAVEIFHWNSVDDHPAGAVRYEDPETGAKTVFMSFGLEAVSGAGPTDRREIVLENILDWFGVETNPNTVVDDPPNTPTEFSVGSPYPNPFNPTISIPVTLVQSGVIDFSVYDLTGRLIHSEGLNLQSGKYVHAIDGAKWGNGTYLLRVQSGNNTETRKILLIK